MQVIYYYHPWVVQEVWVNASIGHGSMLLLEFSIVICQCGGIAMHISESHGQWLVKFLTTSADTDTSREDTESHEP